MSAVPEDGRRVAWAVFFIAMAMLAFELVMTRLFSVILWNHFAFLAISVALFGFGGAGLAVYLLPGVFTPERAPAQLRACALALPPVLAGVVAVLCALPIRMNFSTQMFAFLGVVFLLTAVPFALGGLAITLALTHWTRLVNRIYAFDLVGSALGCGLVVVVLDYLDGPTAALAIGLLPLVGALALKRGWAPVAIGGVLLLAVGANLSERWVRVRIAHSYTWELIYEDWNAFSRISVQPPTMIRGWWVSPRSSAPEVSALGIRIDGDAYTPVVAFDGDLDQVRIVLEDVTSVAYHLRPDAEAALVIGAGGGRDVLAALASGARRVRAVELNPIIARDLVGDRFRDFAGDLYHHPRVELVVGEGRTALYHDPGRYDVVQLSMVDTSAASAVGAYSLTENSLYTLESVRQYLEHLRPGGILTTTWANFPNLPGGVRVVALYAAALRRQGLEPVSSRLAVIRSGPPYGDSRMPLYTVLVQPDGFRAEEAARLRELCARFDFIPIHLPGDPVAAGELDSHPAVVRWLLAGDELEALYDAYRLDLRPVTDDRPFFFYMNRFRDAWQALWHWELGTLYGNGLMILIKLLVISVLAVALVMGLPLVLARRARVGDLRGRGALVLYFLALGVGFIVYEIVLVQTSGYYLGHPLLGLGVSLASMLLFAGVGSGVGSRWPADRLVARLRLTLLAAVALGIVEWALLPAVMRTTIGGPLGLRVAVALAFLAPLGFVLGFPFPGGMRLVASRPGLVPWMWAINAGATVFGTVAATVWVIHLGFSRGLLIGAAVYAVAFLALARMGPS